MHSKNDLEVEVEGQPSGPPFASRTVSLNSDLAEFFLVAGLPGYEESATYKTSSSELRHEMDDYVLERRGRTRVEYLLELRLFNSLRFFNSNANSRKIVTLGDLKRVLETQGMVIPCIGYRTISHLNDVLREYSVEPFRVYIRPGARYELGQLKRAGLEPV